MKIKYESCVQNGTNRLIWAMGNSDIIEYHSSKGPRSVNLIGGIIPEIDLEAPE